MKLRKLTKAAALIAAVGMCGLTISAHATLTWSSPLLLNSPNVVGISIGVTGAGQGNLQYETGIAQHLLDMAANTTEPTTGNFNYQTSSTEYLGTLTGGVHVDGGNTHVAAGYDFVIAKYDGQNAGYVLFYLGGQDADLPEFSYSIWGDNSGQYQISGYSAFNIESNEPQVPEPTTILAGALMLLPFAASALRIVRKNRTV